MGEMTISDTSECDRLGSGQLENERESEWVAIKTLLDANARSTQVLEQHLLRLHYENAEPDYEAIEHALTQAITEHQRIIGDLKLARRAFDQLNQESE